MEAKVLSILAELNSDVDFSAETNLIDDDILDSFDIITLVEN